MMTTMKQNEEEMEIILSPVTSLRFSPGVNYFLISDDDDGYFVEFNSEWCWRFLLNSDLQRFINIVVEDFQMQLLRKLRRVKNIRRLHNSYRTEVFNVNRRPQY